MKTFLRLCVCSSVILMLIVACRGQAQTSGYKIIDTIKLGGEGGWDYLTVDTSAHRLYISRSTHVQVVDTDKDTLVGDILNTSGVHGIAFAQELGKGYTSNGRDSSVTVFDLKTLKTITKVQVTGRNPDAIAYEPVSHRIFTFNGGGKNVTAIDTRSDSVVGTIALDGRPEFAVADYNGKMFVNLEDKSMVVSFDPVTLKVNAAWPLSPGEEPSGLAIDRQHQRLFSGCSNKLMVVLDCGSGKIVAKLQIGNGVDATAYDPGTHLAFSSNGEGTLTVVEEKSADEFTVIENVTTQRGARTMALDEQTHRIYLATAQFGTPPAPTADRPHPRPSVVPGSFVILVLGR